MADTQQIDIPEVGIVEFPATMSDQDVALAASRLHLAAMNAKPLKEPTTYAGGVKQALKPIAKAGLDALPGIGGIVGGALSTPETLGAGTVPGVALGVGAGRGLRDLIGHATGLDAPSSPLAKAGRIGVDTAGAALTQAALPGVVEAIKTPVQTLREGAEMLPGRLGKLITAAIPAAPKATPVVSPDWLAGEVNEAGSAPAGNASPTSSDVQKAIDALRARSRNLTVDTPAPAASHMSPDMVERMRLGNGVGPLEPTEVSTTEPPRQPAPRSKDYQARVAARIPQPMEGARIAEGAEDVARASGMTPTQVRVQTGPVGREAVGDPSLILPKTDLERMIDKLRALPREGNARVDYVNAAKDPKTWAQLENVRRTLGHVGLGVSGGVLARQALLDRLNSDTQ